MTYTLRKLQGDQQSISNQGMATQKERPSKRLKTETHANTRDPKQTVPPKSGNFHPKIVEALSQVPHSPLFGILWPIIVEQASFETRDILREVNTYLEGLCHPYMRSDLAKSSYASHEGNREKRKGLPFVLDLSFDVEWRSWGADKCGFNSVETFRTFCAIGDIDPDQANSTWNEFALNFGDDLPFEIPDIKHHIWISRTKDVVLETSANPLKDGYCHYFGLTGVADKAIAMYNFMHDKRKEFGDESAGMSTFWDDIEWGRGYI